MIGSNRDQAINEKVFILYDFSCRDWNNRAENAGKKTASRYGVISTGACL